MVSNTQICFINQLNVELIFYSVTIVQVLAIQPQLLVYGNLAKKSPNIGYGIHNIVHEN